MGYEAESSTTQLDMSEQLFFWLRKGGRVGGERRSGPVVTPVRSGRDWDVSDRGEGSNVSCDTEDARTCNWNPCALRPLHPCVQTTCAAPG